MRSVVCTFTILSTGHICVKIIRAGRVFTKKVQRHGATVIPQTTTAYQSVVLVAPLD